MSKKKMYYDELGRLLYRLHKYGLSIVQRKIVEDHFQVKYKSFGKWINTFRSKS